MDKIVSAYVKEFTAANGVKFYTAHVVRRKFLLGFIPYKYGQTLAFHCFGTDNKTMFYFINDKYNTYKEEYRFTAKNDANTQLVDMIAEEEKEETTKFSSRIVSINKIEVKI